ncbi:hypothetical protein HYS91_05625 [Candidatus Daviesbacteria bacterium]|nr:hypothetical protein [Candidatus Daviesbacteria bacterium]
MEDLSAGQTRIPSGAGWILFLIIALVGIITYLFFIKPSQIRSECYQYAYGTPNLGNTNEWKKATEYYYEACLRRNGL